MQPLRCTSHHLELASERRRVARVRRAESATRLASAHERVTSARARLESSVQMVLRNELPLRRAVAVPSSNVAPLAAAAPVEVEPVQAEAEAVQAEAAQPDPGELARVLDFVECRARRTKQQAQTQARAQAELLLGEILWNVGEEKARPLVEAVLALLVRLESEHATKREIEALQLWLSQRDR